jgi:uncharacterized protein YegL
LAERIPENIVICIDTSRSMYKSDYPPNRLQFGITAIKKLVEERLHVDPMTNFAIVRFSSKPKCLIGFTNLKETLFEIIDSLHFKGSSTMGEALGLAIKLLITELRKVAAKQPRIILFTDGKFFKNSVDPLKMARLAQGLKIKIDSFKFGEGSNLNILKRMSDITSGNYYLSSDAQSLMRSIQDLANINIKTYGASHESPIENPAFLRKIAADLLRVQDLTKDQEQRLLQIRGMADYKKCSICFSDTNPYTKSTFYVSGRYCPNCQTPYHIHCLSNWAESQKDAKMKKAGTVRCPHCFYLLKIPSEVSQIQKLKVLTKPSLKEAKTETKPKIIEAKLIGFEGLDSEAIYNSCPVCNYIYEEGQMFIKCTNCGTVYHQHCFTELIDQHCKTCGYQLIV